MISRYNLEMASIYTIGSLSFLPFGFYIYYKSKIFILKEGYNNGIYMFQTNGLVLDYRHPTILYDLGCNIDEAVDLSKPIYLRCSPQLAPIVIVEYDTGQVLNELTVDMGDPYEYAKCLINSHVISGTTKIEVLNYMTDYIIPITEEEFNQAIQTK